MEASVAIQVLPQFVESTEEVVRIVDEAIAYIQSEFPDAYVGPFETTIQGEYDHCMKVVAGVNRIVVAAGAPEVATYVKIFFAPEKGASLPLRRRLQVSFGRELACHARPRRPNQLAGTLLRVAAGYLPLHP